ncbi:hypothetical protein [Desulfoluna butyratoxydans]|uniref:Uncharacterized protein n=1 Tax=Desulfoluna butyratoxydans TaxID=231438 RepID=A0A4U8YNY6_9BACT|nr:hypothetical protein [Desulfoluna butyratoxydans]VFQ45856.1 hypothetical protein MSL71_35180 [Desulfoluna butyratoxydans]
MKGFCSIAGLILLFLCLAVTARAGQALPAWLDPVEFHGYAEARAGWRPEKGPEETGWSPLEARFQGDLSAMYDGFELKLKGDIWADGVTETVEDDLREAWVFTRVGEHTDLTVGRQILTWGTGDLVFLNDLFPKDWQAFFIGRDGDYLKAPSDAVKVSIFTPLAGVDLVYTPRFDPDRYTDGTYISPGNTNPSDTPDGWFKDDEIALRLNRRVGTWEVAAYGYKGFWKQPSGTTPQGVARFPALEVYGASARGQFGPGIANLEVAWYRSMEDLSGTDPLVNNSERRYLLGYARDMGRELTISFQYYVEEILDHGAYGHAPGATRDRFRHVLTCNMEQQLFNQTLSLGFSGYWSPTDEDAYLRPLAVYKVSDRVQVTTGANVFLGCSNTTFFGQLEDNTNIYTSIRFAY